MTTVFIAMSGGSDSSYAALLLQRAGYRVIGVTFCLRRNASGKGAPSPYPCLEDDAAARARAAADHLSIPHHVIDLSRTFQEFVIDRFVEEYRRGRTPNPCVLCNRYIKFGALLEAVRQMGDGSLEINLLHPSGPITPGQSVVLYQGETVLGGGIIERGE